MEINLSSYPTKVGQIINVENTSATLKVAEVGLYVDSSGDAFPQALQDVYRAFVGIEVASGTPFVFIVKSFEDDLYSQDEKGDSVYECTCRSGRQRHTPRWSPSIAVTSTGPSK
ncbi:MAG: hypothetical protein IIC82_04540 [Chloroflexi bacterium]|nr:hypothetical protein [Chloroflexota bacterium]